MKRAMLLSILLSITTLFPETIGLLGGSESGTYIKIAKDIQNVTADEMNIIVYPSKGSLYSVNKILKDRSSQFALVQYDALLYKKEIEGVKNLDKRVKMIFPLYNEEIHIIVRKDRDIKSVKDLAGKKVNMDRKNSGSWVTATIIQTIHGLRWKEYNYPPKEALQKLVQGDIDAFIFVVGSPAPILKVLPEAAKEVITLIDPASDMYYGETTISADDYIWLDRTVTTNATKALLVTYNYSEERGIDRFDYYIDNIRKLAGIINDTLSYLRENKHPKWKEIDPYDYKKVKWPLHPAAKDAIFGTNSSRRKKKKRTLTDAEKAMLKALQQSK